MDVVCGKHSLSVEAGPDAVNSVEDHQHFMDCNGHAFVLTMQVEIRAPKVKAEPEWTLERENGMRWSDSSQNETR